MAAISMSIIIPCHNSGAVLPPLLVSLLDQNLCSYRVEVIFVLDTLEDNSRDLITKYMTGSQYDWKIIATKPCPQGIARNIGYEASKGRLIWFIDSDDWLIDNMAIAKIIGVMGTFEDPILRIDYKYPKFFGAYNCNVTPWQYIFRREFISDIKFTDQDKDEDVKFIQDVIKKLGFEGTSFTCHTFQQKLYYYNFGRGGSKMTDRLMDVKSKQAIDKAIEDKIELSLLKKDNKDNKE